MALSDQLFIAALKLAKVGLSVCSNGSGFFAGLLASQSAISLPSMPLWPGYHQSIILT